VDGLAYASGRPATEALVHRLRIETEPELRLALIDALAMRRDPFALPLLTSLVSKDPLGGFALVAAARIAPDAPRVESLIAEHLASDDPALRVRALRAARATSSARYLAAAVTHLRHPNWSARNAAIGLLDERRDRESVSVLIDALAAEPRLRLRVSIQRALCAVTGRPPGAEAADWRAWWTANGAGFQPSIVRPAPSEATLAKAHFHGLPIDSEHVVLVLERSGRLGEAAERSNGLRRATVHLERTSQIAQEALAGMPDGAFVNFIGFHSGLEPWRSQLTPLGDASRADLHRALAAQKLGPGSDLELALQRALSDPEADTLFVLTLGPPDHGPSDLAALMFAVRTANETRGAAIHAVAWRHDAPFLDDLTRSHGGRFVRRD